MTLQKHNFLYFTALPPAIDKFSICAEPFHPSLVRPTAIPRPRSDHLLHVPSAIHPSFQPLLNHDPTAPQPFPIQPTTTLQPQHNHPSCRIKERFRHNHPTFAILQFRQRRAARPWLVHQLPRPSRHVLHHPRREGNRQAAGNAAVSAVGGEKGKTLVK